MTDARRRWLLAGLVGLAFVVRIANLDGQSLWRDEVDAIRFARFPLADLLRTFLTPGQNGPLYFLLLRPWLALAGDGEFSLRFFSLACGVLAVPLGFQVARRFLPRPAELPLVAALLAATSPYLVWYSQEGKMYTLVACLALAATYVYLLALDDGRWRWWAAYVALMSVSFYVHLIAVLLLPAHVLMFFLGRHDRRARLAGWAWSLAALTMPYLPLLAWQFPLLFQRVDTGYAFFPLDRFLLSLLVDYSLGIVPQAVNWSLVPFLVLFLAAPLLLLPRVARGPARVAGLLSWLWVPVLAFFLVTLRRPMFTTRYLIFLLPAYLLLLAAGVLAVARLWRPAAPLLLTAAVALNGWNIAAQARTPVKADFRAATDYLVQNATPPDLLLFQIPYGRYSFDYYAGRWLARHPGGGAPLFPAGTLAYRPAEGLYTNAGMAPEEAERRMADMTAGIATVWLVASEVPMWDARNLVQDWLERHAARTAEASFTRVSVYRYDLR